MTPVVPIEAVSRPRMAGPTLRARAPRALPVSRVVQEVHVQVAVPVVVEEGRLGGIAGEVEAVLLGAVGERAVSVVDVEHVVPMHRDKVHGGDVDVDGAV